MNGIFPLKSLALLYTTLFGISLVGIVCSINEVYSIMIDTLCIASDLEVSPKLF